MSKLKLVKRKECIVLTWQGRILVLAVAALFMIGFLKFIPDFLSINKPAGGEILVLDGQMPDFSVQEAIRIFGNGHYKYIVTTGGQIQTGYYISEYKSMAEFTAASFLKLGFDKEKLVIIPGGEIKRDRTYNSAMLLKKWLKDNGEKLSKIDVIAVGSHARRSRLLFRKAFADELKVGIISVTDPAYNPHKWWTSSVGARTVMSETIAYFYVLIFFVG